jgi:hypothetical protein
MLVSILLIKNYNKVMFFYMKIETKTNELKEINI